MPLPGSRLFHHGFERWGRQVAAGQATAWCRITTTLFDLVWEGQCRVQQAGQGVLTASGVGDSRITAADYVVVITADESGVTAGHLVEIVQCDGDPALVGSQLVVTGVTRGSIRFQQTLTCTMNGPPAPH